MKTRRKKFMHPHWKKTVRKNWRLDWFLALSAIFKRDTYLQTIWINFATFMLLWFCSCQKRRPIKTRFLNVHFSFRTFLKKINLILANVTHLNSNTNFESQCDWNDDSFLLFDFSNEWNNKNNTQIYRARDLFQKSIDFVWLLILVFYIIFLKWAFFDRKSVCSTNHCLLFLILCVYAVLTRFLLAPFYSSYFSCWVN